MAAVRKFRAMLLLGAFLLVNLGLADISYVVKPKDTLYGISQKHGISVAQLAERNQLDKNAKIYVGQRLKIPASASTSRSSKVGLSSSVRDAIRKAPVRTGRWKYIVVHHSGVNEGTLAGTERYHREVRHMENGMAYHFLIGNGNGLGDGVVAVGNRWKKQLDGGHLHSLAQNKVSIGICLIGNFDKTKPTPKQMQALEALTQALMDRCRLKASAVKTHQQINEVFTRCPGTKFPTKSFLSDIKK